ncbi:hypothetical protein HY626_01600 [Candidatus Uhrbacteria bacterium]|nr:hypothetical protein [Candidatus Uhrbacteria bacterium]
MATPEEQKSTLLANRRLPSTSFAPPKTPPIRGDIESSRRSAFVSNRLQAFALSSAPAFQTSPTTQQTEDESFAQTQQAVQEEHLEEVQQAQKTQLLASIQGALIAQTAQQTQAKKSEQANAQTIQQRQEIKQTAKAAMKRGAIFVTDSIAAAFDLGSSGLSLIIDIFIYLFTLGWLNLEMIYGKYFAKGKSKFIGPISWDPIPMPLDKDAIILSGFVVAADIALCVVGVILAFTGFCFLHDMVKITNSVTGAFAIGASLAQGDTAGLCLGGILTSAFGL